MKEKFIRLPGVLDKVGFEKTLLWNKVKAGTFPKQIKLSPRVSVWIESEVDQWIADRIAEAQDGEFIHN